MYIFTKYILSNCFRDGDARAIYLLLIIHLIIFVSLHATNQPLPFGHYREISDRGLDAKCIERAIARSIHQGLGLRFPCNDRTDEVNKLFIIWPFHHGPDPAIN